MEWRLGGITDCGIRRKLNHLRVVAERPFSDLACVMLLCEAMSCEWRRSVVSLSTFSSGKRTEMGGAPPSGTLVNDYRAWITRHQHAQPTHPPGQMATEFRSSCSTPYPTQHGNPGGSKKGVAHSRSFDANCLVPVTALGVLSKLLDHGVKRQYHVPVLFVNTSVGLVHPSAYV